MRKIGLALVGAAFALAATPVLASTILAGPYKNHGDCNSALAWIRFDVRKGFKNVLSGAVGCAQVNGQWYVVGA
jgi:hypothetical protein